MRILVLNYEYPPLGGGAAPVTKTLAQRLVERGHTIDVVTMGYDDLPMCEESEGVSVYRVSCLRSQQNECSLHEMATYLPTGFLKARQLLQTYEYDLIHAHFIVPTGIIASALSALYEIPFVLTPHGTDVPGYNPDRFLSAHRAILPLWRRIVQSASAITSPSAYLADLITQHEPSINVEVIPNGVDTARFNPNRTKQRRILVTSRLFERKGIQHLLTALQEVEADWPVVITGDGPYRSDLEQQAESMDHDIEFVGWVLLDRLETLLETSAIYVFPSCHENCPIALLEAMASGNAIIAANKSGTAEVINDAGVTINPQSSAAFAAEIDRVIDDEEYQQELRRSAVSRAQTRYDWEKVVNTYQELFYRVTKSYAVQ
jgi:glycosyltransferase involved in cell wall biosynthesis